MPRPTRNCATPAFSDRTYIEPITPEAVRRVIEKEAALGTPIDAILPTLGGQTGLNCACALWDQGILQEHGVEMIGADREVIRRAEDREAFRKVVDSVGLSNPECTTVTTVEGVRRDDGPSPLQHAFADEFAVQCGFCIPGFIVAGSALLDETADPTDEQIKLGLSGNLCRCTGYYPIEQAVRVAAASTS